MLAYNEVRILEAVFGVMQRVHRVNIPNYIENIVRRYNNIDFIMHFRLSREKAYDLINRFRTSAIFTSLQGMYLFVYKLYNILMVYMGI